MGHSTASGRASGGQAAVGAAAAQSARIVTADEQAAWNRMVVRGNEQALLNKRNEIRKTLFTSNQPGEGTLEIAGVGKVAYNRERNGSYTIRTTLEGMKRPKVKNIRADREPNVRGEARNTLESEWVKRAGKAK